MATSGVLKVLLQNMAYKVLHQDELELLTMQMEAAGA
jgi:hypothetical protein